MRRWPARVLETDQTEWGLLDPRELDLADRAAWLAPAVRGDRGQVEQVLVNLCVNARDAMPDGGRLTLRVGARNLEAEQVERHPWARAGEHAWLCVEDTGGGIGPEVLERMFEPFFTTKPHGTGLGLASAYGIIKQHGGIVRVDSRVGVGTRFEVFLPAAHESGVAALASEPEEVRGGTETILVAQDEPAVLYVVLRVLGAAGYEVLTAEDGAHALELFRAHSQRISLALLDASLPEQSGADLAHEVRALRPNVGIILSTEPGDEEMAGPAHVDEVVPKPYEPDELLRSVRRVLDRQASARRGG